MVKNTLIITAILLVLSVSLLSVSSYKLSRVSVFYNIFVQGNLEIDDIKSRALLNDIFKIGINLNEKDDPKKVIIGRLALWSTLVGVSAIISIICLLLIVKSIKK
uniref:Uncharacterized protein n=1 Tax=viral metagenome TaxID=1070528 RepID=A0A6C0EHK9_9ZZZZ